MDMAPVTIKGDDFLKILLVRHGESTADLEDRHEGRADFVLTERGCKQAELLSAWIKENYKIDIILSSTLKRAAKTAEYISKKTKVKIIFDEALMEWDNGLLAGLYRSEANEKFPLPKDGRKGHHEFADSESYINFRARAETFWSKFLEEYGDKENKRICIVSHGGMIDMLFRSFLGLAVNTNISISTGDTGVHLLEIKEDEKRIIFLNKQEHLSI